MAKVWKSDQKIIGENIKKARKAAKLTQEQFAEEMGGSCSNKVISRYEKGEVEMGVQTLIDIAENLEVPVDSLMPERVQVHTEPEDDEQAVLRTECREQGDAAENGAYDGTERIIKDGYMIHTVEKKRRCGFFLPIFRSSIEKSTNMWIFESWIPICRGGGSLLILLSYSQFKGQAHRAKTKAPVGSTSDK